MTAALDPGRIARWMSTVIVTVGVVAIANLAAAHEDVPRATPDPTARMTAERLTRDVLTLAARVRDAAQSGDRASLTAALVAAAQQRRAALARLVENDPEAVLDLALTASQRAAMPRALDAHLESDARIEGELEILHEDWPGGGRYRYALRHGGRRLALHFADRAPQDALTGDRVRVSGIRVGDALALGSSSSQTVAPAPTPATFGPQRTAVVLVNFRDAATTKPYTVPQARQVIFDTTSAFFRENSAGQTWLVGDAYGWFTTSVSRTSCDYWGIADDAQGGLRAAGVDPRGFDRLVYVFPKNAGCTWSGLGTVGGSPSHAWLNEALDVRVAGHELGHGLGLYHSHALECGAVTVAPTCSRVEYGDTFDIMGGNTGHFNAFQKELLGWLDFGQSPPITTVTSNGTYAIDAYESVSPGSKALKIPAGDGQWLYVEYRQPIGFDAFIAGRSNADRGVLVHYATDSDRDSSFLLDLTPATDSWWDPALAIGQTFSSPIFGVTITAAWANGASAGVSVTLEATACTRATPTVTLAPSTASAAAGGTASYTAIVTNADSAGCGASTFAPHAVVPAGWTATFTSSSISLAAGGSTSTTLRVTSPAGAAAGPYAVKVKLSSQSPAAGTAKATATYVVTAPSAGVPSKPGHVVDDFHRADSTTLGNGWIEVEGDLTIAGGELRNAPVSGLHRAVLPGLSGATQTVAADFATTSNNGAPRLGVMLRYKNAKNYYVAYRQAGASSVLRIARVVNGIETVLKSVALANPTKDGVWRLTATASGTTITAAVGGTQLSASDATHAAGSVGIAMGSTTKIAPLVKSHRATRVDALVQ